MTTDPIDHLLDRQQALIAALDGSDASAIDAAARAVGEALDAVRAMPAADRLARADRLREALAIAEDGRRKTHIHADRTRTRIDRLARIGGIDKAPQRYGRTGRLV